VGNVVTSPADSGGLVVGRDSGLVRYVRWQRFDEIIEKAKEACKSASQSVEEHFTDAGKTFPMPKGGTNEKKDVLLTRYACYLVAQNGDSSCCGGSLAPYRFFY
jgi:hypothetical protein